MKIPEPICVFVLSLSAIPITYTVNNTPASEDPFAVLGIGVAVLVVLFLLVCSAARSSPPQDPLFYVFTVFSFTCVIDLIISLEQDGFISGFMDFYIKEGEPYLRTPYGRMICYWDGTVHYALYLMMVTRISKRQGYRSAGLYWLGSILLSMIVFLAGNVVGKYGSDIHPAFLLNIPFLFLPVWTGVKVSQKPRNLTPRAADEVAVEQQKLPHQRPLDLLLLVFLFSAIAYTLFRGFVALDCPLESCFNYIYQYEPYLKDPVAYPRVQMLVYLFYALPLLCLFVYGLLKPGCIWMLDWTLVFAGAVAQAQFTHIGGSLHPWTPYTYRVPEETVWPFLLMNLLYALGPQILALRCLMHPEFFLSPAVLREADQDKKIQ
ncbi:transmembrane 6 superfamily member 2-like [Polyodon spathula]|uniref:transmembrane 6 superfamily member 2-like n=1 Tax=Polyodon spathula TaxID=7913 RepID=UPI001B7DE1B8|nr:transmembrane 6 superfamily member 2-like [Polyodon spathula]